MSVIQAALESPESCPFRIGSLIINRLLGKAGKDADPEEIDELTYMMQSGSDRIGALDFQQSAKIYVPRDEQAASERRSGVTSRRSWTDRTSHRATD